MTRSERDAVMAPISDAVTLPSQAFTSDAWYALEVERIFARNWTGTMFGCELPDAGDAAPFDLFDRPLFAVRGDDEHLRVFHNIVPYDGCLAVLAPSKRLEAIEIPCHGLRHDFRGRLAAAP